VRLAAERNTYWADVPGGSDDDNGGRTVATGGHGCR
jgi:hypothetical protein